MDAFRVGKQGRLQEALVTTYATPLVQGQGIVRDPSVPGAIRQEWSYVSIEEPARYYFDKEEETDRELASALGAVLEAYARDLPPKSTFTLPLGGLRCLVGLWRLFPRGVSFLVADKGHTRIEQLADRQGDPIVSLHGSLSMMANLHAVAAFVRHLGGSAALTPHQSAAIDTALVHLGSPDAMSCSAVAFADGLGVFGTCDLFTLRDHCEDVVSLEGGGIFQRPPLILMVAICHLSAWDPDVIEQFEVRVVRCFHSPHSNRENDPIVLNPVLALVFPRARGV